MSQYNYNHSQLQLHQPHQPHQLHPQKTKSSFKSKLKTIKNDLLNNKSTTLQSSISSTSQLLPSLSLPTNRRATSTTSTPEMHQYSQFNSTTYTTTTHTNHQLTLDNTSTTPTTPRSVSSSSTTSVPSSTPSSLFSMHRSKSLSLPLSLSTSSEPQTQRKYTTNSLKSPLDFPDMPHFPDFSDIQFCFAKTHAPLSTVISPVDEQFRLEEAVIPPLPDVDDFKSNGKSNKMSMSTSKSMSTSTPSSINHTKNSSISSQEELHDLILNKQTACDLDFDELLANRILNVIDKESIAWDI